MAQYEHLPIFKLSYDLLIDLYKIVSTFPKEHKYTIGEKIKNYSLELVIGIYEINSQKDIKIKKQVFNNTIKIAEKSKILIRIGKDIKIISLKQFTNISTKVIDILKQLEGWKKSI